MRGLSGILVCLSDWRASVHPPVHWYVPPICLYIPHMSLCPRTSVHSTYISMSSHTFLCPPHVTGTLEGICISLGHFCVYWYICLSISSYQSYQLLNIIVGHLQSHVWLTLVPVCSGDCSYCSVGLEACGYMLRLHSVNLFFLFVVFSLCLNLLLSQLWPLLLLWLFCAPVLHLSSWLLPWPHPWWGYQQCWVRMMWFCHHYWHWGTPEVLLALPLCCRSNLSLRYLFRPLQIIPHNFYL